MTVRIGINGFGRIGRNFFRAVREQGENIEIVAVNDLTSPETLAHLLKYDSILGPLKADVEVQDGSILVDGKKLQVLSEKNPADLPWKDLDIDIVLESTGLFTDGAKAKAHLDAGAKKVVISAPGSNLDGTFVMGVNDDTYDNDTHHVVSNASCTTNCLAPLAKVLDQNFGIKAGLMTTIHSYTADQRLQDAPHKDLRRARAAAVNMIPTSTGAARTVGKVYEPVAGKLDGMAFRVPTITGSIVDLSLTLEKDVTAEEINAAVKEAAEGDYEGIIKYTEDPIVSTDIVGEEISTVFDAELTSVLNGQVKVFAWYDNEWGFTSRTVKFVNKLAAEL
ncbi:type I glyceraldehyde-3-phosphate dehydrogenase [Kocuria koreensis]|uniref:Glyceraldehyde-3-phosphate dehydrogenase n=1 Tax=Rothia koreensis TaxID=592378 RepID=A0A7K1LGQ0_9MICC|nr:type I glyceraldehyde-3-phosphate dehydrogenase [Rothia koreensis]MUN54280.1 type I glyceraldehyde-3-phosphate dehydrogenase [Rothia koreensis]